MPVFKSSFNVDSLKNEIDKAIEIAPREYLQYHWPIMPVTIKISQDLKDKLSAFNEEIPPAIETIAMVYTGAKTSCIDINLARELKLNSTHEADVSTPMLASATADVYFDAVIEIKGAKGMTFEPEDLLGTTLHEFRIGILLGRDFLATCDFNYSGPKGEFTIATSEKL